MLGSKDLFDKSRSFGKCAAKLDVATPFSASMVAVKQYESKSLHRALSNLAPFVVRRFPWSSKLMFRQEFFEIYLDIMEQILRNQ